MIYVNGKQLLLFNVYYGNSTVKPSEPSVPDEPTLPTLTAPTISLDGDILTIIDESGLAESFDILVDGELKALTGDHTFDLSTLGLSTGTHSITVKAKADGYKDSDESIAVSYSVYTYLMRFGVYNVVVDVETGEIIENNNDNVYTLVCGKTYKTYSTNDVYKYLIFEDSSGAGYFVHSKTSANAPYEWDAAEVGKKLCMITCTDKSIVNNPSASPTEYYFRVNL